MKRLLQISLLLNAVLLLAIGWQSTHPSPFARTPRGEVGPPVGKRVAHRPTRLQPAVPPATPWAAIETADPRQLVASLRALGCPEQTIRDIVALRVCRAFRNRLIEAEVASMRGRGFTHSLSQRESLDHIHQQRELRNAMIYTLESALGQNWSELSASLLGWPQRGRDPVDFLSVETRRQLRELDARYHERKFELEFKDLIGRLDAEDAATLRDLEPQRQAELATLLSPQELQEYLYRKSPAADYVRNHLPEAKSESEFRKMVDAVQELQMTESPSIMTRRYGVDDGDPVEKHAETDRRAVLDERLKEVLGEARIAEQRAEEEQRLAEEKKRREAENEQRELAELTELAAGVGIAEADARRFFDRLKALEPTLGPKFEAIESGLTGTDEEKRKQMDAIIKAELGRIATEIVGEKGPALIEKMAGPGK